jgi:hypothetical protein
MGEHSNRAKSNFLAAINEHATDHWTAFLERACAGDASLRAEVDRLLRAQRDLGSFHEPGQSALPETVEYAGTKGPGTIIGPYELLEHVAWCLATAPDDSLRDSAEAVAHAAQAVKLAPEDASYRGILGTARYSPGDSKGAIADPERAISLRKADDATNSFEGFLLAMAYWNINNRITARAWFARSVRWMEKGDKDNTNLRRFCAQAANMLELDKLNP